MIDEKEALELTQTLIDRAVKNEATEYDMITTYGSYRAARLLRTATEQIVNSFSKTAKLLLKNYIKQLKQNTDDVTMLFQYKLYKQCEAFYIREYNNLQKEIYSYVDYVFDGHIIDTILGKPRE